MVTICPQCGDRGYSNSLVYCVNCLEAAIHRYCLDEVPDTLDEFVYWVCDDCEVEMLRQFISLNPEPIQLESRDYIISKLKHVEPSVEEKSKRRKTDNLVLDSGEHACKGGPSEQSYKVDAEVKLTKSAQLVGEYSPMEVKQTVCYGATPITRKTDQIPLRNSSPQLDDTRNEVALQHSESSDNDIPLKKIKTKKKKNKNSGTKSSLGKFVWGLGHNSYGQSCEAYTENSLNDNNDSAELEKKEASHSGTASKKNNKEGVSKSLTRRIGFKPSEQPCEPYIENHLNRQYQESTELENKTASLSEAKIEYNGHQSCEVNTDFEVTMTSNQELEFYLLNKSNKNKRVVNPLLADYPPQEPRTQLETPRFGPSHLSKNSTLENHELAQPLADPIWSGSFTILNKEYDAFEGMVAHLSRKACQKAYEEASSFPTLLELEMHPKSDIWPKSFETSEPSDDNIALYFFPVHERYERMFDNLVEEMLSYELAMRAILGNAELLVFTSTELPLNYWRFQGKYYLWGVFRGKQPPSIQPTSNNHVGSKEGSKQANRRSCDAERPLSHSRKCSVRSGTK